MINIKRKRYIITRKNNTEVYCGLALNFKFRPVNDVGETAIKTYLSRNKAIASFESSWREGWNDEIYNCIEVIETIQEV